MLQGLSGTVMVAEDNSTNRFVIEMMFDGTGITLLQATNGLEAVELYKAQKDQIDLVLMDVSMPEKNGLEATAEIREFQKAEGLSCPIIALTAHALAEDKERCLAAGMDDYLSKPFNDAEFEGAIIKHLGKKAA